MKKFFAISFILLLQASLSFAEITAWGVDYLKSMSRTSGAPSTPDTVLDIRVAPGEYEPAAFAVRADEAGPLSLSYQAGESIRALPGDWVELYEVRSLTSSSRPNRLYDIEGPVQLSAGRSEFFWVTVRPPEGAAAGTYTAEILLQQGASLRVLTLSVEVLPFRLEESPIFGGVFMAETNLAPGWYSDMKEHGLDAIQYFSFYEEIQVKQVDGKLVIDFDEMDSLMADFNASGLEGPVVVSLGNDYHMHYERRIAEAFGWPIVTGPTIGGKAVKGPVITPELDSLYVEGLRQLRDHWAVKAYPQELVILIYDEPTERLLAQCKDRYDLLKTVMPDTRVYGVAMNRRAWAEAIADQCDIIVANGDFSGCLEVARSHDLGYWIYSAPLSAVYKSRFKMGVLPWRVEAQSSWFWMYNYWRYDPDGCVVYPHPDDPEKLVQTTYWEGIREGRDDLRYAATAASLIAAATADKAAAAGEKLEELRLSISPGGDMSPSALVQLRDDLIELILELGGSGARPCDINGDGRRNVLDVISLLILARDNPGDPRADWNGDGAYTVADAIDLLLAIMRGGCTEDR